MTAVLAPPTKRTARPYPLAMSTESFRFTDGNPLSNGTYAQSKFRDLPEHVAYVVTELRNLAQDEWDELVEIGEVFDWVDPFRTYRVVKPEVFETTDEGGKTSATLTGQAAWNDWCCS